MPASCRNLTRKKYDSTLAWFYHIGKDELVPEHLSRQIPNSTISTWRNTSYRTYFGHELRAIQQEALDYYQLFHEHEKLKKTIRMISRVWVGISKIIHPVLQKKKECEEILLNSIQQLFTVLPKRVVLKIAGISSSSFHQKLSRLKEQCGLSALQLCRQRHSQQLIETEVQKIKDLFSDPKLVFWPAVSLYYEGLKNRGLFISLSTFYKYVHLLGLKTRWVPAPKRPPGLKANLPNQFLHVDTTYYEFQPGIKAAIVFVSDNFSKHILGWSIAMKNSAENVKAALQMAINTIHKHHPQQISATLVADGGSENHAVTISELLTETEHPLITKLIALKDIRFSNSAVEAINKIAKRYLRILDPRTFEKLKACIQFLVHNYTETRPHGSLKGLTPFQAYTQPALILDYKQEFIKAKANRIEQNRKINCRECSKS